MKVLKRLYLLLAVIVPAGAIGAGLNPFSGFKVEREVLIDQVHIHHPLALLRASDDGYFILQGDYGNGVVKIDHEGKEEWLYRDSDGETFISQHKSSVEFTTATPLADGGILLGGHRGKLGAHGMDTLGGVLVFLDKQGREINRFDPAHDDVDHRNEIEDFYAVARWGEGFVAIGGTSRESLVYRLRADGSVQWRKPLKIRGAAWSQRAEARSMPGGDLVFRGLDSVVRLNANGETVTEVELNTPCTWVTSTVPNDRIQFLCQPHIANSGVPLQLIEVDSVHGNAQIIELPQLNEELGRTGLTRAYSLAGGGFVLMGVKHGGLIRFTPTILEANADQSVVAQKDFIGSDENLIRDGVPTGAPGEWVVIRPVLREHACTAMTFLHRT